MAKKRSARKTSDDDRPSQNGSADEQVVAAASAVDQARKALRRAQKAYDRACKTTSDKAAQARAVTVGDILDSTLEFVRRHPAAGVMTAAAIGFLLGRTKGR